MKLVGGYYCQVLWAACEPVSALSLGSVHLGLVSLGRVSKISVFQIFSVFGLCYICVTVSASSQLLRLWISLDFI